MNYVCQFNQSIVIYIYSHYTLTINHTLTGQAKPNVLKGKIDDTTLIVNDKEILSISVNDVYLEGLGFTLYTDCEVYLPIGIHSNVGSTSIAIKDRNGSINSI